MIEASPEKIELVTSFIQTILKLVDLENNTQSVVVDGFSFRNKIPCAERAANQPGDKSQMRNWSGWQTLGSVKIVEPRIELIGKQLKALATLIEFTNGKQPVKVVGFSLKNLKDWLVRVSDNPQYFLNYLSWHCKVNCRFCYQKGEPPVLKSRICYADDKEIETRFKYFSAKPGTALFSQAFFETDEVLTRPGVLNYLQRIRALNKDSVLNIVTNGKVLTEDFIVSLAHLSPVELTLSLNSSNPDFRARVMRDSNPQIAINSLPLLKSYQIPYTVSIVPWPIVPLSDIENTILYADRYDPLCIKILMPGYTKYHPERSLFNTEMYWPDIISIVRNLRPTVDTPIIVQPALYEENLFESPQRGLRIRGVVKNSPARLVGLKCGVYITRVNGIAIDSVSQLVALTSFHHGLSTSPLSNMTTDNSLRALLAYCQESTSDQVEIEIEDKDLHYTVTMPLTLKPGNSYPYFPWVSAPYGIIAGVNTVEQRYITQLIEVVKQHPGREILFLTSVLLKPHLDHKLTENVNDFEGKIIHTDVVTNKFFGGNVMLGDLAVVEDFIESVQEWTRKKGYTPDLVIIPSSPFHCRGSGWKRDLLGRSYLEIERRLGVPVTLLECDPARL